MDNINFNQLTGRHSFFSVRETAWHGLGKILDNCPTSTEAIIHAGLDFEVAKAPLIAEIENNNKKVKNRYAVFRTDNNEILGCAVSDRYKVVQNKEAFIFFDSIVGKGQAIYETAGALGKGETIFITAKLPGHIKVQKDDIDKYLLLTMSHDGTSSIKAMFTPIRVVCNNTLLAALQGTKHKVFVRHNTNANYNLKHAHTVLGIAARLGNSLEEIFNIMAKTPVTEKEVQSYFSKLFLKEKELSSEHDLDTIVKLNETEQKILDTVWTYYHNGAGQEQILGTVYGMYNAVTGYIQNVKNYRTSSSMMENIYMGDGERLGLLAFSIAKTYIK